MSVALSQVDARNNEFLGALDAIVNSTVTDARAQTVTLGSLNAEAFVDLNGQANVMVDIRTGAMAATLVFEATVDGTNYYGLPGINPLTEQYLAAIVITTTAGASYSVNVAGFKRLRVRVSAYTSGSCVVGMRASMADYDVLARLMPSTLHVTATAAANTAATATLPAAGAGLFHYITNINLTRNATAALVGSATLIHTTTNLPGSPAWSVGNAMAIGGTQIDLDYTPTTPLKSSVANTATTVVMAAGGAAVLNRVNVSYYVGA